MSLIPSCDLVQSGSAGVVMRALPGDTVTLQPGTSINGPLWPMNVWFKRVQFVANLTSGSGAQLRLSQSGSASTIIAAQAGDKIVFACAPENEPEDDALEELRRFFATVGSVEFELYMTSGDNVGDPS